MTNAPSTSAGTSEMVVAVLGCGYWGVNYVRVLGELPHVKDVLVYDSEPSRLIEVGQRFDFAHTATTIEDVLTDTDCDAVVIATPAATHYELVRRFLEAGKHVLVEKPITTDAAQARCLVDVAEGNQLTLAVGHTFLHNPSVRALKTFIDRGTLGELYYLYARRTNLGPIRHDVDALWDLAPHDISIFNYLLDDTPLWVSAVGASVIMDTHNDVGFVSMTYPSGIVAHIHVSWADPFKVREVVAVGSKQRVVFDDLNAAEPVRVYEKGVAPATEPNPTYFGEHSLLIRDGDINSPKIEVSEPLKNQVVDFLDSITDDGGPVADGAFGAHVVEVMEAIDRSVEADGAPVVVTVPDRA